MGESIFAHIIQLMKFRELIVENIVHSKQVKMEKKIIDQFLTSLKKEIENNEVARIIIKGLMHGEHRFAHFASYFTNPFKRMVSGMMMPTKGPFGFKKLEKIKIQPKLLKIIDKKNLWRKVDNDYSPLKIDWAPIRLSISEVRQILKIQQHDYRITLAELCTLIERYQFGGIPNAHSIGAFIIDKTGNGIPVLASMNDGITEIRILNEKESKKGDNDISGIVWASGY